MIHRFLRTEEGATSIEYALIASMFAIVTLSAVTALGNNVSSMWNLIDNAIAGGAP